MSVGVRDERIDLLRGLSIVLVLLHHFNIAYTLRTTPLAAVLGWPAVHAVVRNGNYAVTMFFAISGFLITSNAMRRWNRLRDIRPLGFYRLRAARILPCILLLLAVVDVLGAAGLDLFRNESEFGDHVSPAVVALASLTFWINVLMSRHGWFNYVLCVQWSLSIEEVFYLGFPLLCVLLKRERLLLLVWCAFVAIGPFWRFTHQDSEYRELNSYLSCFDGIALGCCAAVLAPRLHAPRLGASRPGASWRRLPFRSVEPVILFLAAVMTGFYLWAPIAVTAVYGVSLIAFGTAAILLLWSGGTPALPPRLGALSAPLRFAGRLSYELYLFHLVVLAGLREIWPPGRSSGSAVLVLLAAFLALSLLLGILVSRCYSAPLDRWLRGGTAAFPFRTTPA